MRLNARSDYALRILMALVANGDRPMTIPDIAGRFDLSVHHLQKIVWTLGQLGVVRSTRGRGGGVALATPAGSICLGRILREMEKDTALVECFRSDGGACPITPACRLRGVLAEARDAFLHVLDGYTLADVAGNREALAALLDLSPSNPAT
jgi:Rrf2 family transcriptional regulator, nitric oxide-sensitive transcriptional repressor